MKFFSSLLLRSVALVAPVLISSLHAEAPPVAPPPSVTPDAALRRLMDGNARFAANDMSPKPPPSRREEVAKGQRPFAIIVGCADSRVAPELLFDEGLGDLFVTRLAGNLVEGYALGSIEYAVAVLGARLIVVLGHERCGAVDAALTGAKVPGHIPALVKAIAPAVKATKGQPGDPLANAIKKNAELVANGIRANKPALSALAGGAEVRVVSAYYDLDTGKIEFAK